MDAQELKDLFEGSGVRPIEVALDQEIDPSVVSNYMRGVRAPIPDEFAERTVRFIARTTQARAKFAEAFAEDFLSETLSSK